MLVCWPFFLVPVSLSQGLSLFAVCILGLVSKDCSLLLVLDKERDRARERKREIDREREIDQTNNTYATSLKSMSRPE